MHAKTVWRSLAIATALLSYQTPALAGGGFGFMPSALNFRDAAANVYQQGRDVCGDDCEPAFSGALSSLGATLEPLNTAIAGGDPSQIRDAINNTAGTLSPICTVLRVECPSSPLGSKESVPPDAEPNGMLRCDCEHLDQREEACERDAYAAQGTCWARINEFVGCRLQTPFCDSPGAPFDAGAYAACRSTSYYRQYLQECRCPFPPGQGERQGGCPAFFSQPVGQVSTAACEVPDGQGCARCCNARCLGADPRGSCQGANREECDVCEWSRRTFLAGNSLRTSLCEGSLFRAIDRCVQRYIYCVRSACH